MHACPMKRLGACKHHNPTIRSRLIYLPIKAYWKHVFQRAAAKTGPTPMCDAMRCDAMKEERQRERQRKREKAVNHASGFKSDTVKSSFRSDLRVKHCIYTHTKKKRSIRHIAHPLDRL